MLENRVYFVIDMKSFFASVECSERGLDPFTANLVVADEERTKGTVCLAITPHMKELGIKNRCRLYQIPSSIDFIIAKPRMKKYIEYSAEIYGIYLKYIDKNDIHVYSIDECFLDVTDYLKLYKIKAKDFAQKLMNEIYEKLKIPSTVGIGTNMFLAKIALDITAKHSKDRIGWLNEEKFKNSLWHHKPLTDFWQIANGTVKRLEKFGIFDLYDLAHYPEEILYKEFGVNAELLIDHAWGRETCTMKDIKNYKKKSSSISSSQILPCGYTKEETRIILKEMVQSACYTLARKNYVTNLVHLDIGYQDFLEGSKGTRRMHVTTNLYSEIIKYFEDIFDEVVNGTNLIRKINVSFCDLQTQEKEQYDLFSDENKIKKEKNIVSSLITIQDKFGKNAVLKGLDLNKKATIKGRNNMIGGHNE